MPGAATHSVYVGKRAFGTYSHGPIITFWAGHFYVNWYNAPRDEANEMRVLMSSSVDGEQVHISMSHNAGLKMSQSISQEYISEIIILLGRSGPRHRSCCSQTSQRMARITAHRTRCAMPRNSYSNLGQRLAYGF
eukprot:SAG31_NODE_1331_length_8748_cov_5.583189_9_plen_135_part_00